MHPAMTRLQNSQDFNNTCLVQLHMNKESLNLKPKIYFDHLWYYLPELMHAYGDHLARPANTHNTKAK